MIFSCFICIMNEGTDNSHNVYYFVFFIALKLSLKYKGSYITAYLITEGIIVEEDFHI